MPVPPPPRLRDLRTTGLWSALVLAVAVLAPAWPLLTVDPLPLTDYPQHLGTIAAMHGQGSANFASYFSVDTGPVQYLLYYLLSDWLAWLVGVETAARLVLVVGLAGLPLAVAALLRAHGRPALWGAAAGALVIHVFVLWGFINYCMAIPLAILALAALARLVRVGGPGPAAVYGGLALLLFYAHAQLYAWMALASVVQVLAMLPVVGLRAAARAAGQGVAAALPSAGAAVLWVLRSGVLDRGVAGRRGGAVARVATAPARFEGWRPALRGWEAHSFEVYRGDADQGLAHFFVGVMALLLVWRIAAGARAAWRRAQPADRNFAPEALLATAVGCALFAPVSFKLIEPISHRFVPLALALLPALAPRRVRSLGARLAAGFLLIALALQAGRVHTEAMTAAAEEVGDLDGALSHTRPGRRLVGLIFDRSSRVAQAPIWLHAQQYYQVRVGGLAAFGFVEFPISPLVYRTGAAPTAFPPRFEWRPEAFDYARYRRYFDYYLLRVAPGAPTPRFWGDADPPPRQLFHSPRWRLYGTDPGSRPMVERSR